MLLGNNVSLVIYSIIMAKFLGSLITIHITSNELVILLIQTLISTMVILFFAEFLPKTLFRINPNRVLSIAAVPLIIIYYVLYPFTYFTVGISNLILTIFVSCATARVLQHHRKANSKRKFLDERAVICNSPNFSFKMRSLFWGNGRSTIKGLE